MTRRMGALTAVSLLLLALFAVTLETHHRHSQIELAGHTVFAPQGRRVNSSMSFDASVMFVNDYRNGAPYIDIVDKRQKPDDPGTFVAGFRATATSKYFQSSRVDEYVETDTKSAGLNCASIRNKQFLSLLIFCTTARGNWRLVLSGDDSAIMALDTLARQMPMFEAK